MNQIYNTNFNIQDSVKINNLLHLYHFQNDNFRPTKFVKITITFGDTIN